MINQNPRWLAEKHDTIAFVEERSGMPVNPPVVIDENLIPTVTEVSIMNWLNENDELEFRPRLSDNLTEVERGPRLADDDEAPELDWSFDCD